MLLAILDHLEPPAEPRQKGFIAPGRINAQRRIEHIGDELEAHLIVAAACGAVADYFDALLGDSFDQAFGCDLPAERGGAPIASLITGLRLNALDAGARHLFLQRHADE